MQELQERIGYRFQNTSLLAQALTHASLSNKPNNQRLEFLGDAVLSMVIARLLYDLYPGEQEGELARRRAALICGPMLATIAREIRLGEALNLSSGEADAGGRDNESTLEDALEALIGALYLDGGMGTAEAFIRARWDKPAQEIKTVSKDAKTALQEWAQGRGLPLPAYRIVASDGPGHAPEFTIEVTLPGHAPLQAKAASKRAAEQAAAKLLLEHIHAL